jgi:N-acetylglucosaminyldiphosphoundecaprenol N-acetyl-beta-D-mannosaminyltransferase
MPFSRISFLGVPLDIGGSASEIFEGLGSSAPNRTVSFIEPDVWMHANRLPDYLDKLSQMSLILPDATGVALACSLLTYKKCLPFSFDLTSVAPAFFRKAAAEKIPLAVVGGQPRDDEDSIDKLVEHFPGLNFVAHAHGYGDFGPKIAAILAAQPKAVIVSIHAPRREEFMIALRDAGYKGFVVGCSGFLEHYAHKADYRDCPDWVIKLYLVPLYKLFKEPQRLWQRYIFGYKNFILLFIAAVVKRLARMAQEVIRHFKQK